MLGVLFCLTTQRTSSIIYLTPVKYILGKEVSKPPLLPKAAEDWEARMLERTINRYISWAGLFVLGILIGGVIWNWKLLSVAFAFAGLLTVSLAVITDNARGQEKGRIDENFE